MQELALKKNLANQKTNRSVINFLDGIKINYQYKPDVKEQLLDVMQRFNKRFNARFSLSDLKIKKYK